MSGGPNTGNYGGQNQTQSPANWWGGPGMRWGGPIGTPSNWTSAQQNMPGASDPNLLGAAGLYGTPWQGPGVGSYGRWNWANQMQPPQQPPGGYQPAPPPGQSNTPPPATPGSPPRYTPPSSGIQPAQPSTQPGPMQSNQLAASNVFGLSNAEQQNQAYNPGVQQTGDIWSNPAFANMAAALGSGGGGGLFGSNTPFVMHPRGLGGVRTR